LTVIAWDGKTLAADRLLCAGETKGTGRKIFRVGAELVGFSGTSCEAAAMLAWYRAGADVGSFPQSKGDDYATMLVIRGRRVWKYDGRAYAYEVKAPCAIGCGAEGAMVAMACGKNAREAVLLASRFNNSCGNGVDVFELKEKTQ
jgi:hypothetical protein